MMELAVTQPTVGRGEVECLMTSRDVCFVLLAAVILISQYAIILQFDFSQTEDLEGELQTSLNLDPPKKHVRVGTTH
jgi:hypothetical protein